MSETEGTRTIPIPLYILFTYLGHKNAYSAHYQVRGALPSQDSKPGKETDAASPSRVTCSRSGEEGGGGVWGRTS